ncbi:MAG TPA: DUF3131 domain-containing protein [Longimicrobiaceae bacterium]|nr:DUF3131 domain-containing protein [Longimicrobiaceae bacterium]
MRTLPALRSGGAALLLSLAAACGDDAPGPLLPELPSPPPAVPHPDRARFLEAARGAWTYADRQYHPATGLINSVHGYPYATVWDIASGLAALYCAHGLGLLPEVEYDARMRRALGTLQTVRWFDGVAPNKNYSTRTGAPAGRNDRDATGAERGLGWSATDLGRLLVWLRVIAVNHPRHATDVRRVVERIDFAQLVGEGYLWGAEVGADGGVRRYQEGRLGYEQYAALGFALWGRRAERALRLHENTLPVTVLGVPLAADRRGHDPLTSEPFVLTGLELGWSREMRELATRVLRVQEERFRGTGQVTMASEDHVPVPPHYFYYYAINYHGHAFSVVPPDADVVLDWPRWVSTKAAFAWHALLPGDYTRRAVEAVAAARDPERGWSSGVYEGSGAPTGSENVNTVAVILEAALFSRSGRPLVYGE